MHGGRSLLGPALIALLVAGSAGGQPAVVELLSPVDGDVVAGETEVRVAVDGAQVERVDVYVRGRLVGSAVPPEWRFTWTAPLDLSGTEIVALAYAGGSVVTRASVRTAAAGFSELVQVVGVDLFPVVLDRRGRYVRDLAQEEFTVLEDGRPVELDGFERTVRDFDLVIVLDVSGSMSGQIGVVQSAAESLVARLDDEDQVAVYAFNHGLRRVSPMTADKGLARKAIRELSASGGTALYDSLLQVLEELPVTGVGRTVVVVFSDGRDESSLVPLSAVVARARKMRVVVYSVATEEVADGGKGRFDLEQITSGTGGLAFPIRKLTEIGSAFEEMFSDIQAQYRLSYTPLPGPAGLRRIEVRVARKGLRVRCRESYSYGE